MRDRLRVYLHGRFIGEVERFDDGRISFDFDDAYRLDPDRPTLSQAFLTDEGGVTSLERLASSGFVPSFFSNLLPEGQLRTYLARTAGVRETQEFELLEFLGADLPGAVEVRRDDDGAIARLRSPIETSDESELLRFSLAGVQLKFSAIERRGGGLTIPAHGLGGDWIVKLPSTQYPRMSENEYSVMSIAERVGIDVPEVRLVPMSEIQGLPTEITNFDESNALAVRRFDRDSGRRIHIEDFAQALAQYPSDKYNPAVNYADLTRLVAIVCDERGVIDFANRLMFNAIVGNGDMHLKNWSFIYPDGVSVKLSPAYDLLCTTVYIPQDDLALRLGAARKWQDLSLEDFVAVADRAGVNRTLFVDAAVDTASRFHDRWKECANSLPVEDSLKLSIEKQMTICPAIQAAMR